jgi:hypothetical protein
MKLGECSVMANEIYLRIEIGDHHEIFCNGEKHLCLAGSSLGRAHPGVERDRLHVQFQPCDCTTKQRTIP